MTRPPRWLSTLASSKPASWFFIHIGNPIDRRLLPATNGRISISLGQPVLCLEVRGAKSGQIRRTPLLFRVLDGALVLVASATGLPKHPAWYHNIVANPDVKVYAPGGRTGHYVAHVAAGEERQRLWNRMVEMYPGFEVYLGRTEGIREIPIVVLTRSS